MTKSELKELLDNINDQFWHKLTDIINDTSFLKIWYEALKDYDYDLIKYIYGQYRDAQFPPTAKYFTVFSDQMIDTVTEEIRLATNEIWIFSTDEYQTTKSVLTEYIKTIPWKDKLQEIERVKRNFLIDTREEKQSLKDWMNERRE